MTKSLWIAAAALATAPLAGMLTLEKAQANFGVGVSACSYGVAWDSYGAGLQAGFENRSSSASSDLDESCFQFGHADGLELRERNLFGNQVSASCARDFSEGVRQGAVFTQVSRSECFNAGYSAGSARTRLAVRRGDARTAGASCMAEYRRGLADAARGQSESPSSSALERECYLMGRFEGA